MLITVLPCFISVILSCCGLLLICMWPVIFDNIMALRHNSLIYHYWKTLEVDVNADYYFFNWTNAEDFYNRSIKPKFEEVGPYSYLQKAEKINITWNNNDTVTFKQKKIWIYQNKKSGGGLEDRIVTLNPVPLIASYILRNWNYYAKKGIYMTLSAFFSKHYMTQTAGSLLFEGYPEPLIKVAAAIPIFSQYNFPKWDAFAYFYNRNNTDEFEGTFNTGIGKRSPLGSIHYWNYKNKSVYYDDACAEIEGSSEQFFPRNLRKDSLKLFMADLGGFTTLTFEKEETVNNVLGYKYVMAEKALDNGTKYPENRCLCNGECVPSGMINTTSLRNSLPVFASLPHFYKADPYYLNLVDGLKPNESRHELFIIVEPTTGIPLKGNIALQLNLLVQPVSGISMFENAPKFFCPVWWATFSFELQGFLLFVVKFLVNLSTICISIGVCTIIIAVIICVVIMRKICINRRREVVQVFSEEQSIPLTTELQPARTRR